MRRNDAYFRLASIGAALALLAGCSGGGPEDPAVSPAEPSPTSTSAEPTAPATTGDADPTTDALPGEVIEIFPYAGDQIAVVGVEHNDVLNVRNGPGASFEVIVELEPLAEGIVATGHNRSIEEASIWAEVNVGGATGWASVAYLGFLADVEDVTSEFAELPSGPDLAALGLEVADERLGPDGAASVVVSHLVPDGDLAEVVVDAVGFLDDSVLGSRLHVFAVESGGTFTVRTVEATTLCSRGVADGACL